MVDKNQIDPKHLKGLKFRYSEGKQVVEDGRKVVRYAAAERPLKPEDVLDWKDTGEQIVLVTADGRKVTVDKEPDSQNQKEKK